MENTVVSKSFVYSRKNFLLDFSSAINIMVTIHKDFWLDNWDKSRLLNSSSISG